MSVMSVRWPFAAIMLATLVMVQGGCSRYGVYERNMERNMRYVSSDVLRNEAVVAYDRLRVAHEAWRAAPDANTLESFRELYTQYEVIYNELIDRAGGRTSQYLARFGNAMPPPPPGVPIKGLPTTPLPKAKAEKAGKAIPAKE